MFRLSLATLLGVLVMVCATNLVAAPSYTITDLGALTGMTSSIAYGVNDSGVVVGAALISGVNHAFMYSNGQLTDIGNLGVVGASAYHINNNGLVVGVAGKNSPGGRDAFSYSGSGPMQDLGTLGNSWSEALSVNDSGQAVGDASSSGYSVLFSGGRVTTLNVPCPSSAYGINNTGQIVGHYTPITGYGSYGYLYSGGVTTTLQAMSVCEAINDSGQVVGASQANGDIPYQPAIYENGTCSNISIPSSYAGGWAMDINAGGEVVGRLLNDAWQYSGGFLYDGGATFDLQSLIRPSSGWTDLNAIAISDNGFIVGQGQNSTGQLHAFLLTPVPEPSTFILLAISALSVLAYGWRRRRS